MENERIQDTFTYNMNDTTAYPLGLQQMNPTLPTPFNVYMDVVMKEVKMGMGRREESGYHLNSLCTDHLVLCGESVKDLRALVGLLLKCVQELK